MGSIIFVHGTGVREKGYAESLHTIRINLEDIKWWEVKPCLWGKDYGARLKAEEVDSVPNFDATRKDPLSEKETAIALWAELYEDSLYELRLLELRQDQKDSGFIPNQQTASQQLEEEIPNLGNNGAVRQVVQDCRFSEIWTEALRNVIESSEYDNALSKVIPVDSVIRETIARAIVAEAWSLKQRKLFTIPINSKQRDQLVDLIVEVLGGREKGIMNWLSPLKQLVARPLTNRVRRNRGQFTVDGYAVAGDILLYQARGENIRNYIRQTIEQEFEQTQSPVVLLAHSLGGIACVDLLNLDESLESKVKLLITVGSQAPFFYELDALTSLSFGQCLKRHFPPYWLNIYDTCDFLSYRAEGVFPDAEMKTEIKDERVDNQEPFPYSHSAYWTNEEVWTHIRARL